MNRTIKSLLFTTAAITAAAAGIYVAYRTRRKWIGRALNLPPAQYEVGAETHLVCPCLTASALNRALLSTGRRLISTILVRTPYGLSTDNSRPNTAIVNFPVQRFVERGYHVVLQSVRGRFGSEGRWIPFVNEAADGRATLDWIARQPWFNGCLGTFGGSYPGYAQWAVAADAPPHLKAMVLAITTSNLIAAFFPADDTLGLDTTTRWMLSTLGPNHTPSPAGWLWLATAWDKIGICGSIRSSAAQRTGSDCYRPRDRFLPDWLAHSSRNDPHWEAIDPATR
jgi:predicted acyl esterase